MDQIINLLPLSERRIILEEELIEKAVAIYSSYEMQRLMILWRTYVEPTVESTCNPCLARVLKNFREMHNRIIELQFEAELLRN